LGTGVDPLKYIDEFGADAARFAVIWQATGQDIRWDETAVTAGKKFANKIWNAAKFVMGNIGGNDVAYEKPEGETEADKKILARLEEIKGNTGKNIESFEFSAALKEIYDFFWHEFCDVYLETAKKQLDGGGAETTKSILSHVLLELLIMLHPFMPFVTEAVYQKLPGKREKFIMIETWQK